MKIIEPKYEILTDISEGGIKAHQFLCRLAIRRDLVLALVADPGHPFDLLEFFDASLRNWWAFW